MMLHTLSSLPHQSATPMDEDKFTVQHLSHQVQPSSSPSHDFSFTHPPEKPTVAVDFSPADEIFFHGQLLPLHLISHLPISPRASTQSVDGFTLPIRESGSSSIQSHDVYRSANSSFRRMTGDEERGVMQGKEKGKSKSFSLFTLPKRRNGEIEESKKRKVKFDVYKWYLTSVKPILDSFRSRGKTKEYPVDRRPFSLSSSNLASRNRGMKKEIRGRRGQSSAPASMIISPANSGIPTPTTMKNDSTMEELQAAIQAAIAHCKNSIAAEDNKLKPSIS